MNPPPEILYENGPVIIALKPPGLLTQSPPGIDSLEDRIKDYVRKQRGREGKVYLGVPHRLDRPASGVMVFARNVRAAKRISEQFEARQVEKTYWALVEGNVEEDGGTWIDYMRKIPGKAHAEIADPDYPGGQKAVLHYRVKHRYDWGTWLEIELETGRTHQVRVQCASREHPVLGDVQYGSTVAFGEQHEDTRLDAIALHARSLKLVHPKDRKPIEVVAAVSEVWGEWIGGLSEGAAVSEEGNHGWTRNDVDRDGAVSEREDTMSEKADAAFRESAADVIRRAKETGTPVVIREDGEVKHVSPDEFIAEGPHAGERKVK